MGDSPSTQIQEKGEIYFFYKPKVGVQEPHCNDDVQRMYLVLRPEAAEKGVEEKQSSNSGKEGKFRQTEREETPNKTDLKNSSSDESNPEETDGKADSSKHQVTNAAHKDVKKGPHKGISTAKTASEEGPDVESVEVGKKPLFRYMVMGRKSLPEASKRGRPYWGFVELVTSNPEDIKKLLAEEEYETKTRGHRVNPAARPVGEGVYTLVRHHAGGQRTSTHLVYKLEQPGPHKKHEPQDAMNIETQASFVIQIKNPEQPAPASTKAGSRKRHALLPVHMQGEMGSKRFVPADPPDLLNYEGVEFLLIPAHDNVDVELDHDLETSDPLSKEVPDLIELLVSSKDHQRLIRPLLEGEWA